jgi:hypothetical protein
MKLLTATRTGQGEQAGDFCFAVEGELVILGFVCATDRNNPDGGCGCGRAFSGLSSKKATTTALVRDLDLSVDDVRLAVEGYYAAGGMGPNVLGEREFTDLVAETVAEMAELAPLLPADGVIGRRLDDLILRSEPSPVPDH